MDTKQAARMTTRSILHTLRLSLKKEMRLFCILLLFVAAAAPALAQKPEVTIARGIVTIKNPKTGQVTPGDGAIIKNLNYENIGVATANLDGVFEIRAFKGNKIRVSHTARARNFRIITIKDTTFLRIELTSNEEELTTVEITGSQKDIEDAAEPAEGQIHGNYYVVSTRFKFQEDLFKSDNRIVLQPVYHDHTTNRDFYMPPRVLDGPNYHKTQDRMYAFEMDSVGNDPLASFVHVKSTDWRRVNNAQADSTGNKTKKKKHKQVDILEFVYTDSIYIDNPNDVRATVDGLVWREDYLKIFKKDTTIMSNGMVNTLRWIDYTYGYAFVDDEALYPQKQLGLRSANEGLNIRFDVNKFDLKTDDEQNRDEINRMLTTFSHIAQMPSAKIYSLTLTGKSSPEGDYAHNLELSRKRMESTKAYIKSQLPANLAGTQFNKPVVEVATWDEVVALMRADKLDSEADAVQAVIDKYKTINAQGKAMRQLPFYAKIDSTYLPRLRSVSCQMRYDMARELTTEEVKEYFEQDPGQLVDADLFKYYRDETTPDSVKETILQYAVKKYPSSPLFANDYSAILLKEHKPDAKVLEKFIGKTADPRMLNAYKHKPLVRMPKYLATNQMASLMAAGRFQEAYELRNQVPNTEATRTLLAMCSVRTGHYKKYYDIVAATGPRNEIALALHMDTKSADLAERALALCDELPADSALTHYFRAMACGRLSKLQPEKSNDYLNTAEEEIKTAFKMDPSLIEDAIYNFDVNGLEPVQKIIEKREEEALDKAESALKNGNN